MEQLREAACRHCGEALVLLPTVSGGHIAVDAVTVRPEHVVYSPLVGHHSHHLTCQARDNWHADAKGG
jgi:hypothetical protein